MIVEKHLCYFCHSQLTATQYTHANGEYIYICKTCPTEINHIFYFSKNKLNLTLRYDFTYQDIAYFLYLYPTYSPSLLLTKDVNLSFGKAVIELESMEGFSPDNIHDKAIAILNLKAFY